MVSTDLMGFVNNTWAAELSFAEVFGLECSKGREEAQSSTVNSQQRRLNRCLRILVNKSVQLKILLEAFVVWMELVKKWIHVVWMEFLYVRKNEIYLYIYIYIYM